MYEQQSAAPRLAKESGSEPYIRHAGGAEYMFWLLDQNRAAHFAMVADIEGPTTLDAWHSALLSLQQKHPLLSARLDDDPEMGLCFRTVSNAPIPLRVTTRAQSSWQAEVARELADPFDYSTAPLIRTVLIHEADRATLILLAHHSVADGMAASFMIEDLLRSLNGEKLTPLEVAQPMEGLLESEMHNLPPPTQPPEPQIPVTTKALRPAGITSPNVESLSLTPELTASLVARSREEETTVHGALSAAIHEAGRRLCAEWRDRPVRIFTPVNIRDLAKQAGKSAGVYLSTASTTYEPGSGTSFWDIARATKRSLDLARTREATLMQLQALQGMAASRAGVEVAASFLCAALAFDSMLTNLGSCPIRSDYGALRLQALRGPAGSSNLAEEQTVGVCTTNGALCMVHTSYAALPGFLDTIHDILFDAVSVVRSR